VCEDAMDMRALLRDADGEVVANCNTAKYENERGSSGLRTVTDMVMRQSAAHSPGRGSGGGCGGGGGAAVGGQGRWCSHSWSYQ